MEGSNSNVGKKFKIDMLDKKKGSYIIVELDKKQVPRVAYVGEEGLDLKDETNWQLFMDQFPDDNSRYAIMNFKCDTSDTPPIHKELLLAVMWNPEGSGKKNKVAYTFTWKKFCKRAECENKKHVIECNERGDVIINLNYSIFLVVMVKVCRQSFVMMILKEIVNITYSSF